MSWDRTWRFKKSRLKVEFIKDLATKVARTYAGVSVEVEKDGEDILCAFLLPTETDDTLQMEVEISIYDLGADGHVISLEADAADNHKIWDDASQLAEDLAEKLQASDLEL